MISRLKTERQTRASADLDKLSALEVATLMSRQDTPAIRAVRKALPQIAEAIELIQRRLAAGGRLIYVGSGTSGRIGALDASECSPTFGTDPETIQYEIAGGDRALTNASEASEDSTELGVCDMAASKGAATVAIICNRGSALAKVAQLAIEAGVDPEVLTGSMRLKAGTAQKIICNMLTTGAMARLGYVYGNMMVNLQLKNEKLNERGVAIVLRIAKVSRNNAETTLKAAAMKMPVAVVMPRSKVSKAKAIRQLKRKHGNVRKAIEAQAVSTYTLCSLDSSY